MKQWKKICALCMSFIILVCMLPTMDVEAADARYAGRKKLKKIGIRYNDNSFHYIVLPPVLQLYYEPQYDTDCTWILYGYDENGNLTALLRPESQYPYAMILDYNTNTTLDYRLYYNCLQSYYGDKEVSLDCGQNCFAISMPITDSREWLEYDLYDDIYSNMAFYGDLYAPDYNGIKTFRKFSDRLLYHKPESINYVSGQEIHFQNQKSSMAEGIPYAITFAADDGRVLKSVPSDGEDYDGFKESCTYDAAGRLTYIYSRANSYEHFFFDYNSEGYCDTIRFHIFNYYLQWE